jgi:hypothetical protein
LFGVIRNGQLPRHFTQPLRIALAAKDRLE